MPSKSLAKNLLVSCLKQKEKQTSRCTGPHTALHSYLPRSLCTYPQLTVHPPCLPHLSPMVFCLCSPELGHCHSTPTLAPSPFTWLLSTPPIPKPHPHVGTPSSSYPGSVTLTGAPAPSSPIPPVPLGQPSEDNCPVATIRSHPLSQTPFSASSGSIPTGPSIT